MALYIASVFLFLIGGLMFLIGKERLYIHGMLFCGFGWIVYGLAVIADKL